MKIEKINKVAANLHDKSEYPIRIRNLKQALNHGLVLKKVHRQEHRSNMNTYLRKKAKNDFVKDFLCSFWKNYGKCDET